ncbi:uncharacterized protein EI90DRAFT_3076274 [Cantharellus anzutake]|uniref:uncharacterized protein n=1 Tax=Cantharellus anzutake TaxID=1750568 RepID=UPI0019037B28|nr:uncharacterized protein EI90DRAFT_3076274 [Cantharellus anzutake]KAF8324203.1 hypothetical protein EI90DRAFT_3076274 [Cantharellus anzutake]
MKTSILTSILSVGCFLISPALALVGSISAPTTVLHPGHKFTVTFHTSLYIQNNLQFYALFGIWPSPGLGESYLGIPIPAVGPVPGADGGLGLGNFRVAPSGKGKLGIDVGGIDLWEATLANTGSKAYNVTLRLPVDLTTPGNRTTNYTLQTGVLGTVGASGLTTLSFHNTTIRIKSP